jgi:hypothetical protein
LRAGPVSMHSSLFSPRGATWRWHLRKGSGSSDPSVTAGRGRYSTISSKSMALAALAERFRLCETASLLTCTGGKSRPWAPVDTNHPRPRCSARACLSVYPSRVLQLYRYLSRVRLGIQVYTIRALQPSDAKCCISWRHSKLQLSRYVIKPQRHLISVAWA